MNHVLRRMRCSGTQFNSALITLLLLLKEIVKRIFMLINIGAQMESSGSNPKFN